MIEVLRMQRIASAEIFSRNFFVAAPGVAWGAFTRVRAWWRRLRRRRVAHQRPPVSATSWRGLNGHETVDPRAFRGPGKSWVFPDGQTVDWYDPERERLFRPTAAELALLERYGMLKRTRGRGVAIGDACDGADALAGDFTPRRPAPVADVTGEDDLAPWTAGRD